jgi:ribosomal protein S18 acetylase RimI-like enzyme
MKASSPPPAEPSDAKGASGAALPGPEIRVRRIHRRDLNRVWEFLKLTFRNVNRQTVEYQRPRLKKRFLEVYEEEGVEQLIFEVTGTAGKDEIVGYTECTFEVIGEDNWINESYFEKRDMRPLYIEELAVHPAHQGQGIGGFVMEQLEHLGRVRGCTHLVLEVAENNDNALRFYRVRNFYKLDAAIFLAKKLQTEAELLPPRKLRRKKAGDLSPRAAANATKKAAATAKTASAKTASAQKAGVAARKSPSAKKAAADSK